jgi:hypothetical protein
MLVIRKKQQEAFTKAVARGLECNLLTHATRQFPVRVHRMGEPAARAMIRKAVAACGKFGIEDEYEISRYLDLMFLLGEDFDTDASLPWAAAVLGAPALAAKEKMDRLCERAGQHLGLAAAAGPMEHKPW